MRNPFRSARFRRGVYVTATAAFALAGVYGVATTEQAAAWLNLIAAATTLLAAVNTRPEGADE